MYQERCSDSRRSQLDEAADNVIKDFGQTAKISLLPAWTLFITKFMINPITSFEYSAVTRGSRDSNDSLNNH